MSKVRTRIVALTTMCVLVAAAAFGQGSVTSTLTGTVLDT